MSAFSFYDELTSVPDPDKKYEATDLTKHLIKVVGHEVSGFSRNALHSYGIVQKSQAVYQGINNLIEKIDNDAINPDATDFWDEYDSYTKAIDPLEAVLLELSDLASTELSAALPPDHSVNDWENSINAWKENRESIKKISTKLGADEFKPFLRTFNDLPKAQIHDDSTLMSTICRDIEACTLVDDNAFGGKGIENTKALAASLPSKISETTLEPTAALGVQSVMLVHAAMDVATNSTESSTKEKLESPEVWTKAESLLTNLSNHLTDPNLDTADLESEWKAYLEYLKTLEVPVENIPKEYYELRKTVRTVRRPYHSRTLALVSHCRTIAEYFKGHKSNINLKPLVPAVKAVVAALTAATAAIENEIVTPYEINIETSDAAKAFIDAETEIQKCFKAYGMEADWTAKAQEMTNALALDKERVEKMNKKFEKYPQKPAPGTLVKVTLNKTSGQPVIFTDVDVTTRLTAILWKAVQQDSALVPGSHFKKNDVNGDIIGMDRTVKDVNEGGDCTLYLVETAPNNQTGGD